MMNRRSGICLVVLFTALVFSLSAHAATVSKPTFDKAHGFYGSTFSVRISSATSGATIRYTVDGSKPTASYGTVLSNGGSVSISKTTCLRAVGCMGGMTTSQPFTQTYIFLSNVLTQTRPSGYPTKWGTGNPWWYKGWADYDMDSSTVSTYSSRIQNDLKAIPTLSIVGSVTDILGNNSTYGVYGNGNGGGGQNTMERGVSVELIYASGGSGFQIDCGLKAHSWQHTKRSLRLLFKSSYGGPATLNYPFFETARFNAGSEKKSYGKIFLRAGMNSNFAGSNADGINLRDQWGRDTQILMSGVGSRGIFVHLYINGLYWGVYNPVERPDARHCANYIGGAKGDWHCENQGGDVSGTATRYDYLINTLGTRDQSSASNYNEIQQYLDLPAFIDYVMLGWFTNVRDWQRSDGNWNNFYACTRNSPAGKTWYLDWDMEITWNLLGDGPGGEVHPAFKDGGWYNSTGHKHIARPFRNLFKNADFRTMWADRVYQHCFNGGPLTDSNCRSRFSTLANYVEPAMTGDCARWGDMTSRYTTSTHKTLTTFRTARDKVLGYMNGNVNRFISSMRAATCNGYQIYPSLNPPAFVKRGGTVASGFKLTISRNNSSGTIFYRADGSDPRASGGGVSSGASSATSVATVTLTSSTTVKARVKNGSSWSALEYAAFTVTGTAPPTTPSAPSSLAAAVQSTTSIRLTWTDNSSNETQFKVERSTTGTSGWVQIATPGANTTTYTDSGLSAATKYYYRVRASNSAGNSGYSNVASATTGENAPSAPSSLAAAAQSATSIRLTW
ncbi:MAG: CotH kinase family protein, partial [Kiritimatiellae bacterium]|nr:CotH kinase family protein [Kiritimatiellia bacterium]